MSKDRKDQFEKKPDQTQQRPTDKKQDDKWQQGGKTPGKTDDKSKM